MDDYLTFAKDLARQGGKLIKDAFDTNLDIELKSDHTPVTQVDKRINSLVIDAIHTTYPTHGVLGEEESSSTGTEEYQWLCDPLDGTTPFIIGTKNSTFILGLLHAGELQLSVVYNPYDDKLYHAVQGRGAFCNDQPIHVNDQALAGSFVIYDNSSHILYDKIVASGAVAEPCQGAGFRSMLLAEGRLSAIVQLKADHHDVGPASLIVEEAGGKVTDLSGVRPCYDRPLSSGLILSNGICHSDLLKAIT